MAEFEIRFLKEVCNDTGHAKSVLQRVVKVEAEDESRARETACAIFCARENVGHWRDHADRIDVVQLNWCDWKERAPREA